MNERLHQLANEARIEVSQRIGYNDRDREVAFEQKFAELITREILDQVAEFNRLTKAYQTQGIDPEIDITKEVLKNFGFTRFPRS